MIINFNSAHNTRDSKAIPYSKLCSWSVSGTSEVQLYIRSANNPYQKCGIDKISRAVPFLVVGYTCEALGKVRFVYKDY